MVGAKKFACTMGSLVLVALTGCATTLHGSVASSADRLEHSADAMARDARGEPDGTDYATGSYMRNARDLAADAHDLRRVVEDRRGDDRDVRSAFDRVAQSYHDLRDKVERTDSREARADLKPVTEAYLDLERAMGPESHSYARDADARDRDRDYDR